MKNLFNISFGRLSILLIAILLLPAQQSYAGDYFKSDKVIFDFYSPNWVNSPNKINSDYNKSFGFAFTWGSDRQIKKSHFSYFYGISYDYNTISSNVKITDPNISIGHPSDAYWKHYPNQPKINKFKLHYIDVPFEIRFRTQTRFPLRVYVGSKIGYLIKSSYHHEDASGNSHVKKQLDGLEPIKYGLTLRLGYGMFNLYSYYGLNSTFDSNVGGGTNQFSFGLSLLAN